jgi:hypothetical protein
MRRASPPDTELLGTAEPVRRSGAEGAPDSPRGRAPDGLGRDADELLPDGLDIEPPPLELPLPLELPPPPPDGRETAEPVLLPLGFGRAPD